MEWIANLGYWVFGACAVTGLVAIAFLWERMRRDLNLALPAEQKISVYPSLPKSVLESSDLGHFVKVLDRYEDMYPESIAKEAGLRCDRLDSLLHGASGQWSRQVAPTQSASTGFSS